MDRSPWVIERGVGPIVGVALHAGHDLRPEVARLMALGDSERRREEDPFTDVLVEVAPTRVVVSRSRFELDLNRPCEEAVCLDPEDCWGLDVWRSPLDEGVLEETRRLHVSFYEELGDLLRKVEAEVGPFVVLDIHSYNHRRNGPAAPPDDPKLNPDVNVGTGSLDRDRWGHLVDRFIRDLGRSGLDVGENVKFKGRRLAQFVHENFPDTGCCLALEFKKTFMDEHTGTVFEDRLNELKRALQLTLPGLIDGLREARAA
jgi:N-formylglutamate amidohydrolase